MNPFEQLRQVKSAVVSASLRKAEKALRQAESTRRTALEDVITTLRQENKKLQDQSAQASAQAASSAAESSALAQAAASPMPTPPAAQPAYGMMAAAQSEQQQQGQSGSAG